MIKFFLVWVFKWIFKGELLNVLEFIIILIEGVGWVIIIWRIEGFWFFILEVLFVILLLVDVEVDK